MWQKKARFCPLCKADLVSRLIEDRRRLTCEGCSFVLYLNPAAAAATVVLQGRQILLIRRKLEPYKGDWTLPAGYEEYDESPAETAVRETKEETGLIVSVQGLYDVLYTRDDPRKPGILVVYLCHVVGGTLSAGDDALEAQFFDISELPENIGFRNNRRILERLRRELEQDELTLIRNTELPE